MTDSPSSCTKRRGASTWDWAGAWILVSAYCNAAGWILSAPGALNGIGYFAALAAGLLALGVAVRTGIMRLPVLPSLRFPCRFRRFFPAVFLLLFAAALVGGALYAPTNYDALTYRYPRILHWISEGRWHWIYGLDVRMNMSGTGMEWLMAPLFLLARGDRLFFLINVVSYALLPGLTYAVFHRLGMARRVAWYAMWLLPCGYNFATQAGSVGNDTFAAIYLLAALGLALRFRETRDPRDFWLGMLAVALLTANKASNLPLGLPWLLAAWPGLRLLKGKIPQTALVGILCVLVSFVPLAWMNYRYTGDWAGDPQNKQRMKIANPVYGVIGNGLQLLAGNMAPPVLPVTAPLNRMAGAFTESPAGQAVLREFPTFRINWNEFQSEENAGLGFGLCGLLAVTALAGLRRRAAGVDAAMRRMGIWVCAGAWVAWAVYMAKMGSEYTPRLLAAYYPLLAASVLLLPGVAALTRRGWWKLLAGVAAVSVVPSVVLTPARPLWPALSVCEKLAAAHPGNQLAERAQTIYATYRNRNDSLAALRKYLTPEDKAVGFSAADISEVALWRPFGQHRVVGGRSPEEFARFSSVLFMQEEVLQKRHGKSLDAWLKESGGCLVATESIQPKASRSRENWYVIRFGPQPIPAGSAAR